MTASHKRYVVRFTGHVQGVGFRATAVSEGRGLTLHGWVRNEPDGSVRMDVEGPVTDLDELMHRIKTTMTDFINDCVVELEEPLGRSEGFRIRY